MENVINVIRIINNHDCQFNKADILNNKVTTLLDFTDYLNLRMVCCELHNNIQQFLCFEMSEYKLYNQVIERGDLFLFYDNTTISISSFIDLFGYVYGQVAANNINIYDMYVNIEHGPEELVQYYGNPELLNRFEKLGITPLHAFVYYNRLEVVKILLKYENVNKVDLADETILHVAIRCNYANIAAFLIKNTAIDLNIDNDSGETAFILACECGSVQIMKLLIANGVNPAKQPYYSVNDLIKSCIEYPNVVRILIDHTDNVQDLGFTVDYYLPSYMFYNNTTTEKIKESIKVLRTKFH